MKNTMEMIELETDLVRVFVNHEYRNEHEEDIDDYYEDEDEEWGNTF
ncbi:MAG: hypothetical protein K0R34_452 [Herbinix sp.]|jgi:hypothetical protein|nr:hypothetical protein [Herbinix sp.]